MRFSFGMNILSGFLWLMMIQRFSLWQFCLGFLFGFLLLLIFPSFTGAKEYIKRVKGILFFIPWFLWIFLKANFSVLRIVLFVPRKKIAGKFIQLDVSSLTHLETLLYAHFITLTPGTTSVEITPDENTLLIHTLSKDDQKTIEDSLKKELLYPIQKFTRP